MISTPMRLLIAAFGVLAFSAGTVGSFRYQNNSVASFSTLIVVGAFAFFVAAIGRWPSKIGPGGVEMDPVVKNQLRKTQKYLNDKSPANLAELEESHAKLLKQYNFS